MTEEEIIQGCNPNIRKTVRFLRAHGYNTTDSGDGATHQFACDLPYGYVSIRVEPSRLQQETDDLMNLLMQHKAEIGYPTMEGTDPPDSVCIEASYSPVDGVAIIHISHITDDSWTETPL